MAEIGTISRPMAFASRISSAIDRPDRTLMVRVMPERVSMGVTSFPKYLPKASSVRSSFLEFMDLSFLIPV